MKENFKVGDWCFCEFKLQQITDMTEGRITEVSDGIFILYSFDLSDRCFPLEMDIKRISDDVAYWSRKFHDLQNSALNHPDLNRRLVSLWVKMCKNKDDVEELERWSGVLSAFGNTVVEKVRGAGSIEIDGIPLFRI